ncbi:DUF6286 domain-containing protein [Streptomyces sp. NBC_01408]|uniref:DUF6286 domain-containing protein n=1 Tax=Streptomyces sp. NBC_01408 TaxID=2903855 RepID=UPI002259BFA8|nr:DUF6286 domain-containing protein [Streptomyces sp. NBC_01408]MCX4694063.1 DUF6286 domain-containing protein [Streptomyces sp. NBC_01408]
MTAPGPPPPARRAHRFRSARRIPAALTALLLLAAAGLFLYDLAAVRADRPGMSWRRELAGQLDRHTPADLPVLVGGGVLAAAGAVLLLLALAPGVRGILPMRTPDQGADLRAGLGRKAAAQVLRDRAMEVSGVRTVRVTVGRAHVRVRATSHFRELDDVRADLDAVLAVGIEELGLAHPPRPRVRVSRAADAKG